jgi:predicted transposase YbfD/YdcC
MVLAQVATDAKSNEITAVPKLLVMLSLKGTIVTAGALNCQRPIAEQIVNQGGNYALALKENQPTLHAGVDVLMNEDQATTRLGNGPHNLAVLRHMALNVLQKDPTKGSLRGARDGMTLTSPVSLRCFEVLIALMRRRQRRNTRSRSTAFVCPVRVAMPRLHKYIQYDDEPEPKTKAEHGRETEGKKRPAA